MVRHKLKYNIYITCYDSFLENNIHPTNYDYDWLRWEGADSSKWCIGNMCTELGRWLPHNWGCWWSKSPWEGGQVLKSSLSPSSSSFCPRYNSGGKYLGSLNDLATPRAGHACTTFFTNGEQVKISKSCPIIFLLCFKQALLVAGGESTKGARLTSTEIFTDGKWSAGGNLPR